MSMDKEVDSGLGSAQGGVVIFGFRKYTDNIIRSHVEGLQTYQSWSV